MSIEANVRSILEEIRRGNCFGEAVTLVAATKTRTPEEIERALGAGITDFGENRVQEFCEKYERVRGGTRHFIGRLQTNKVKFLVGRCALIHSVDRDALAEEISRRAAQIGAVQDILVQINIGDEPSKGGYPYAEGLAALLRLGELPSLRPRGFMAMLPLSRDEALLADLADRMRRLFEKAQKEAPAVRWLSMGMSGDWRLCLGHGANMIRLGSAIFGERGQAAPPV